MHKSKLASLRTLMEMYIDAAIRSRAQDGLREAFFDRLLGSRIIVPGRQTIIDQAKPIIRRKGENEVLWFDVAVDKIARMDMLHGIQL